MELPIIEMSSAYPFGLSQPSAQEQYQFLVHKELPYINGQEKENIEQMIHFVKTLSHQYLINLASVTTEANSFHLYYEYVPFKLESWVLGVNQELAQQLQDQLMELADFLSRSSIAFVFDPQSVGLSPDLTVKYFLKEFSVDLENQNKNCQKLQLTIKEYLAKLKQDVAPSSLKNSQHSVKESPKEKGETCKQQETVSTTASIQHINQLKELPQEDFKSSCNSNNSQPSSDKSSKIANIYQKIQNSKQKSMEVLLKLKSFNRRLP